MAAKRKSTKKKATKKVAPRKTATASTKKKKLELSELRYSSGKLDDKTVAHIEELEDILGVHEVNHFGTNDDAIFEKNLKEMTLADLQNLCGKVRLFASGNTRELKEKLRKEFTRVTKGNKSIVLQQEASVCNPDHPNHAAAKKILSEGF
jgi:hypothetical protein